MLIPGELQILIIFILLFRLGRTTFMTAMPTVKIHETVIGIALATSIAWRKIGVTNIDALLTHVNPRTLLQCQYPERSW